MGVACCTSHVESEPAQQRDQLVYNAGKVMDHYDLAEELGQGSYGSVVRGRPKKAEGDQRPRAIKMVSIDCEVIDIIYMEIDILAALSHPNIIRLYEAFEDTAMVYMVLEACEGGSVFEAIVKADKFSEQQTAHLMQQIFKGVRYMHQKHVAHRDIKGENCLLQARGPIEGCLLKIVDFGTSRKFVPGMHMTTSLGTPQYIAPEVLRGSYREWCDLWSCGCLMFLLLCGYLPFDGKDDSETLKLVGRAPLLFRHESWGAISRQAKDLVRKLVMRNVRQRLTAAQALASSWMQGQGAAAGCVVEIDAANLQHRLNKFCSYGEFKKVVLSVIARQLAEDDIGELREVFTSIDKRGTGFVSRAELREALCKAEDGVSDAVMRAVDTDMDGYVEYVEFLAAAMDKSYYRQEKVLKDAFRVFDREGRGAVSAADVLRVLASGGVKRSCASQEQVSEMMAELGKGKGDQITFEDFQTLMWSHMSCERSGDTSPSSPANDDEGGDDTPIERSALREPSAPWLPLTVSARALLEEAEREEEGDDEQGPGAAGERGIGAQPGQQALTVKTGAWRENADGTWGRCPVQRSQLCMAMVTTDERSIE